MHYFLFMLEVATLVDCESFMKNRVATYNFIPLSHAIPNSKIGILVVDGNLNSGSYLFNNYQICCCSIRQMKNLEDDIVYKIIIYHSHSKNRI